MKAPRSENAEKTSRDLGNRLLLFLMILLLMLLLILLPLLLLLLLTVARKFASRGRMLHRICKVKIIWCIRSSISICVMKNPVQPGRPFKEPWRIFERAFEGLLKVLELKRPLNVLSTDLSSFFQGLSKGFHRQFTALKASWRSHKECSVIDLYGDQGNQGDHD